MATKRSDLRDVLRELANGPARSSLFHWMAEHHDSLLGEWSSRSMRWTKLCATFKAHGLTDLNGNPPSERTARMTWYRVRLEVRRVRALKKPAVQSTPRMLPPTRSQAPTGWQPGHTPAKASSQPLPPPADTTGETEAEAEARADANIARILRHIDEAAGRVPPRRTNS